VFFMFFFGVIATPIIVFISQREMEVNLLVLIVNVLFFGSIIGAIFVSRAFFKNKNYSKYTKLQQEQISDLLSGIQKEFEEKKIKLEKQFNSKEEHLRQDILERTEKLK